MVFTDAQYKAKSIKWILQKVHESKLLLAVIKELKSTH